MSMLAGSKHCGGKMSNTECEGEGECHETGFELEEVSLQNHEIQSLTLLLPGHLSIHLPDSL